MTSASRGPEEVESRVKVMSSGSFRHRPSLGRVLWPSWSVSKVIIRDVTIIIELRSDLWHVTGGQGGRYILNGR